MQRLRALTAPAWIVGGAVALRLVVPFGFVSYDTLYSLVWGQQIARGQTPTYDLVLAPTPHPLAELLGVILAPLGAGATLGIVVALAYLALSALTYLVYRLGAAWFSRVVGIAAAALLITRYEVLSYGVRAYVDIPYTALVLAALLVETRRRRAGWPVIALLDLAGLLRPEAWLFAGVYWLYLVRARRSPRELAGLAALAALAPVVWLLSDLAITGNLLWSLSHTRSTAATLKRPRGLVSFPYTGARRLGEVLGPDGLVAAAIGGVLSLWLLRSRALLGFAAGVLAIIAFAIVASSDLPIDDRYTFVAVSLLTIFAGAGLFGWRLLVNCGSRTISSRSLRATRSRCDADRSASPTTRRSRFWRCACTRARRTSSRRRSRAAPSSRRRMPRCSAPTCSTRTIPRPPMRRRAGSA